LINYVQKKKVRLTSSKANLDRLSPEQWNFWTTLIR